MSEVFATVGSLHKALDYHQRRHNVLAGNIANVDTPGFKPFELLRVPDNAVETNMPMAKTREGHMQPAGFSPTDRAQAVEDPLVPAGVDGNAVSLEREMSKLGANDLRYQAAAKIIRSRLAIIRYVATDGMGR